MIWYCLIMGLVELAIACSVRNSTTFPVGLILSFLYFVVAYVFAIWQWGKRQRTLRRSLPRVWTMGKLRGWEV